MMTRKDPIIFIGGGGHARVLIDLVTLVSHYEIKGIVDAYLEKGTDVFGVSVLGGDELLEELYACGVGNACIAVGSVKTGDQRRILYEKAKNIGFYVPPLVHRGAIIAQNVRISEGVQVMAGCIIQAGSVIGENSIINTGTVIDHDCIVGQHVHACSGVVMSGGCKIGDDAFIGAGATVIQGISIGKNSVVAAGAVVVMDVPENTEVMGIPAKIVNK